MTTLATLAEVKLYLHTQGTVVAGAELDDDLLTSMLEAATDRVIEARPERTIAPDPPLALDEPVERRFPLARIVQVPDLREVTEVTAAGRVLAETDYLLRHPRHDPTLPALWIRLRYAPIEPDSELVITGRWGPAEVAPRVREAVIVWVARAFHQRTNRFADNASAPDGSGLGYFRNLPPDVKVVLDGLWVPGA